MKAVSPSPQVTGFDGQQLVRFTWRLFLWEEFVFPCGQRVVGSCPYPYMLVMVVPNLHGGPRTLRKDEQSLCTLPLVYQLTALRVFSSWSAAASPSSLRRLSPSRHFAKTFI